ncbi:MAG: hypothetical protein QN152_07165 [Armatimonadota bacterium]|nr:hypothetical protein [Armatimonadota bacterium]MDR7426929.1 hypothetical protein [Armatimonadota bacterium]MDR7464983.1 hypothetical protein [Armatimonadota bacterium]MDR7470543.1 hypothetical protein [Armatimonadota bacterium]MDR7474194.1 hypothetical protein [Armatimonadota bacterium]
MSPNDLHGAGVLVWVPAAGNLVLAAWAGISGLRARRSLSPIFWAILLLLLAILAVQAGTGLLLVLGGVPPRRGLHLLYAGLVATAAVTQYGLRPGGFLRRRLAPQAFNESRVLALLCLTQAALIMRTWMTGLGSP